MKLILNNIKLYPDQGDDILRARIAALTGLTEPEFFILKKSMDARKKNDIHYVYRIILTCSSQTAQSLIANGTGKQWHPPEEKKPLNLNSKKFIIAGTGPAGLFAALRIIEHGGSVVLFERGRDVDRRMADIARLENRGILNEESNVLFGEGGAGTYSDGKLTARSARAEAEWFYDRLIDFGADDAIAYTAHAHVGTDRLRIIVKNIREYLLNNGAEIFFDTAVAGLLVSQKKVYGVITDQGHEFKGDVIVLATGHSARDTYQMLFEQDVLLEKKGFAVGARVEHNADFIKKNQYGNSDYFNILPPAEYRLVSHNKRNNRGTYSFCMCPGGNIINASSEKNMLCTNGMSNSVRGGRFSNAAIVVTVKPEDITGNALGGIEFQRSLEQAAFKAGGGLFKAPAQRVTSFLKNRLDSSMPESSYKNGLNAALLEDYLPQWITDEVKESLKIFDRRIKGFISDEALFAGVETRTSSPVRIVRGENFESISHKGLYPVGEGAGYAGGIVSSAVDAIRAVDAIAEEKV